MERTKLESMTVLELRALAKERHVKLSAGIDKKGIIDRLAESFAAEAAKEPAAPAATPVVPAAPVMPPAPAPVAAPVVPAAAAVNGQPSSPVPSQNPGSTVYSRAYHNPIPPAGGPRFAGRPAYQAQGGPRRGDDWHAASPAQRTLTQAGDIRPAPRAPMRFGPGARPEPVEQRPVPPQPRAPFDAFQQERQPYGRAPYGQSDTQPEQRSTPDRGFRVEQPTAEELLSPSECRDGAGILEMHPDGYGFLRNDSLISTGRDIYLAAASIRRFGLRTGDYVTGKVRPQRDSDRFPAMLYVETVNSNPADTASSRPMYDSLTPVYPSRRIDLSRSEKASMRMLDLMLPLGYGQRSLLLCQPDSGKEQFLKDLTNAITTADPQAEVILMLTDESPEDVTDYRDHVNCRVIASTFDQSAEAQLRQCDLTLERAERLVEQGKNVVLLVDSLTRISKTATAAAVAQGRAVPGNVNPASLFKAKRLFGAARALREGGSLTILATLNVDTGAKVDDAIIQEFRSGATQEIYLDAAIARAGVYPAIDLTRSLTRRIELLADEAHLEGIRLTKLLLGSAPAPQMTAQLIDTVSKTTSTDDYLSRVKDWAEMLKKK